MHSDELGLNPILYFIVVLWPPFQYVFLGVPRVILGHDLYVEMQFISRSSTGSSGPQFAHCENGFLLVKSL